MNTAVDVLSIERSASSIDGKLFKYENFYIFFVTPYILLLFRRPFLKRHFVGNFWLIYTATMDYRQIHKNSLS